jgi:two-component system sensor histidine kinase ResE
MFKKTLVIKIIFGYSLIILASLLVVGLLFISIFRGYVFQNKITDLKNKANQVAMVSRLHLTENRNTNEYDFLIELLDSFVDARVWITDKNGNIISMSQGKFCNSTKKLSLNNMTGDATIIEKVLAGQVVIHEGQCLCYNEPMITVGVPVSSESHQLVGSVFLHSPVTGINETINKALLFLFTGIISTLLLSVLIGAFYSMFITKPLQLMNTAALEMAKGNYAIRTGIRQKDEIGQLSNSLDSLAAELESAIDALFQEKGKLSDIIASISEGILAFDLNLNLLNFNQSLMNLCGYHPDVKIAEKVRQDLAATGILNEFKDVIESGTIKNFVYDWHTLKLKFIISPVKNNGGEITGVVALIQDISESVRLEQMRKDFVANVSHEFRTPLTLIKGSVESLIDRVVTKPGEVKRYYYRILKETNGLESLVKDLLDLNRLQEGKLVLQLEKLDVNTLITDIINSFNLILKHKKMKIVFTANGNLPPVTGDYDKLRQLLIIFIDNAIKYSPDNTTICISGEVKEYVYLKIADQGIGIPKEEIPFIWERFYKVEKSHCHSQPGTGLGLAIAKYLIEAHKATAWIESEAGNGTIVTLGLPF